MRTAHNKRPRAQIPVRCVEGPRALGALRVAGEGEQQAFRLRVGVLVAREENLCILHYIYINYLSPWVKVAKVGRATISMQLCPCHVWVALLPLAGAAGGARYKRVIVGASRSRQ